MPKFSNTQIAEAIQEVQHWSANKIARVLGADPSSINQRLKRIWESGSRSPRSHKIQTTSVHQALQLARHLIEALKDKWLISKMCDRYQRESQFKNHHISPCGVYVIDFDSLDSTLYQFTQTLNDSFWPKGGIGWKSS